MLKRATLVGKTTGGAAHAANFHSVGDNFYLGTANAQPINLYSKYDWNDVGIEPDVKVTDADALNEAQKLAERNLNRGQAH
jgi:C-terminal processing protease CtpA/Prc